MMSDDVKRAIKADKRTVGALARDARTSPIQVWRFLNGERGLTTRTLDRLVDALGLKLAPKRRRK